MGRDRGYSRSDLRGAFSSLRLLLNKHQHNRNSGCFAAFFLFYPLPSTHTSPPPGCRNICCHHFYSCTILSLWAHWIEIYLLYYGSLQIRQRTVPWDSFALVQDIMIQLELVQSLTFHTWCGPDSQQVIGKHFLRNSWEQHSHRSWILEVAFLMDSKNRLQFKHIWGYIWVFPRLV